MTPAAIAAAFEAACRAEIEALKPGNVHVHAGGHGMSVADFLTSAKVSAPAIAAAGRSVGERILAAVEATRAAVGQNTNLGIILLCAPLATAAETGRHLADVLAGLSRADASAAFRAIRIASPGGLGRSARHDVAEEPEVTLLEAMRQAAGRDRIARQYSENFVDVLNVGVPALRAGRTAGLSEPWAVTWCYLAFLSRFADSHVLRKQGPDVAEQVRQQAAGLIASCPEIHDLPSLSNDLISFDRELKTAGINPGTGADLTVASHLAAFLYG